MDASLPGWLLILHPAPVYLLFHAGPFVIQGEVRRRRLQIEKSMCAGGKHGRLGIGIVNVVLSFFSRFGLFFGSFCCVCG